MDGLRTDVSGQQKQSNDSGNNQHNPQYANCWALLTRKRHIPPHSAQPQHTNYWAPRTRKRHRQQHRPPRPSESSDPTQHAKGRTGDCPGPRKGATTRRNVTQGGGGDAPPIWCGGFRYDVVFLRRTALRDRPSVPVPGVRGGVTDRRWEDGGGRGMAHPLAPYGPRPERIAGAQSRGTAPPLHTKNHGPGGGGGDVPPPPLRQGLGRRWTAATTAVGSTANVEMSAECVHHHRTPTAPPTPRAPRVAVRHCCTDG